MLRPPDIGDNQHVKHTNLIFLAGEVPSGLWVDYSPACTARNLSDVRYKLTQPSSQCPGSLTKPSPWWESPNLWRYWGQWDVEETQFVTYHLQQ